MCPAEQPSGADGPQRRLGAPAWLRACGLPLTGSVRLPERGMPKQELKTEAVGPEVTHLQKGC